MENSNNFNKDYKPQAIVLNANENAQNGNPKNIITELVNDINLLKIAVGDLNSACLNKDEEISKYEDLINCNFKKFDELTEKMENCKNLVKLLETANANLTNENKHLKAEIKQKDERIKELKKINKLTLEKCKNKVLECVENNNNLKKENEELHKKLDHYLK